MIPKAKIRRKESFISVNYNSLKTILDENNLDYKVIPSKNGKEKRLYVPTKDLDILFAEDHALLRERGNIHDSKSMAADNIVEDLYDKSPEQAFPTESEELATVLFGGAALTGILTFAIACAYALENGYNPITGGPLP